MTGSHPRASRLLLYAVLGASLVGTIGCDRLTKRLATDALAGAAPRSFLADTVRLEYAENRGGFLSLGEHLPAPVRQGVFVGATGLLLLLLAGAAVRLPRGGFTSAGLALFLAGGVSNWADRLADGHVVDFIVLRAGPLHTGIFNVADVAITVGVILLIRAELMLRNMQPDTDPHPCSSR
jgi:signal peptidase II